MIPYAHMHKGSPGSKSICLLFSEMSAKLLPRVTELRSPPQSTCKSCLGLYLFISGFIFFPQSGGCPNILHCDFKSHFFCAIEHLHTHSLPFLCSSLWDPLYPYPFFICLSKLILGNSKDFSSLCVLIGSTFFLNFLLKWRKDILNLSMVNLFIYDVHFVCVF